MPIFDHQTRNAPLKEPSHVSEMASTASTASTASEAFETLVGAIGESDLETVKSIIEQRPELLKEVISDSRSKKLC